ncbi:MAG: phosphotyrosine protein phosphatase [Nanoarchaeota archaeon]|nr:phosphotyrosine protein phosphatase [Nanoarchaeota archaeon]
MKLLFICNQNKNRSKKAELLLKNRHETKSAGLFNEKPVTKEQIDWADSIFVMEDEQRKELGLRFPQQYLKKRIVSLDIPDIYSRDQPELELVLMKKIKKSKLI